MSKDLMWRRENEKTCNLNQALTHWTQKKVGARVQSALVTFSLGNAMPWTSIQCLIYWSGKCNAACRLQDSCWRNKHPAFQMEDFLPHGSLLGCTFRCRTTRSNAALRARRLMAMQVPTMFRRESNYAVRADARIWSLGKVRTVLYLVAPGHWGSRLPQVQYPRYQDLSPGIGCPANMG